MRIARQAVALFALMVASSVQSAVQPNDYAQGIRIEADPARPIADVLLPDTVYQTVTRADLTDVRVFNAENVAVPHALCGSSVTSAPVVSSTPLPVFQLQGAAPHDHGTQVNVETAAGTQVRIQEGEATTASDGTSTQTWAHVIEARGVTNDLRSIEFDWSSPDGASQANVRIDASADLDQWRTVVSSSTLLRVSESGRELQRKSVPLPPQHYDYLRVVRTDGGPPLQIDAVIGEQVSKSATIEPLWFTADQLPRSADNEVQFDARRVAPIRYVRVRLPLDNAAVHVRIQSRPDEKAEWRDRWAGEVYAIINGGERRASPPVEVDADHDRYWRLIYVQPSQALEPPPALELGYRPARLRFLAQGRGPFLLAFGSRRAEPAVAQQCGGLLADVSATDLANLTGDASLGAVETLGGETAFKAVPARTPVRLLILWAVLIVGTGLVIAMALSLLKRLNPQSS